MFVLPLLRQNKTPGCPIQRVLENGIVVVTGPGTARHWNVLLAYKVYLDGREEMVRGARLVGMSADSFKEIVGASKSAAVYTAAQIAHFDFSMISRFAGERVSAPLVSYVVPSLLFDDLTLAKPTTEVPKPPFSSRPTVAQ